VYQIAVFVLLAEILFVILPIVLKVRLSVRSPAAAFMMSRGYRGAFVVFF
jgi:hypothetical protein